MAGLLTLVASSDGILERNTQAKGQFYDPVRDMYLFNAVSLDLVVPPKPTKATKSKVAKAVRRAKPSTFKRVSRSQLDEPTEEHTKGESFLQLSAPNSSIHLI